MEFKPCKLRVDGTRYFINAERQVFLIGEDDPTVLNDGMDMIGAEVIERAPDCVAVIVIAEAQRIRRNKARRQRDQAMRDIGMVKVRGALGGTYWE